VGRRAWERLGRKEERYYRATNTRISLRAKGNIHCTVKGVSLLEYLIRLVTPRGGIVLDPFAGSGTTGIAAVLGGWNYILIEQDRDYVSIAKARLQRAKKQEIL
jgi:DNA modification methylase